MYSPVANQRMVELMDTLGPEVAYPIAASISEVEYVDQRLADTNVNSGYGSDADTMAEPESHSLASKVLSLHRDPELHREERLFELHARIKDLEQKNLELSNNLKSSQDTGLELRVALDETRAQLEHSSLDPTNNHAYRALRARSTQDINHITELEAELESSRAAAADQKSHLDKLSTESRSNHKLLEDLQLLRAERDDLLQKAKANENLTKKIQALQEQERTSAALREEIEAANEQLGHLDQLKDRCTVLQKANEENLNAISNSEQEIFDSKRVKKRLEHEVLLLTQKLEAALERQARDYQTIVEQESRIREFEATGQTLAMQASGSLDHELAASEDPQIELKSENAKLKEELARLQVSDAASTETKIYEKEINELQARNRRLQEQCFDIYQDNHGVEHVKADGAKSSDQKSASFTFEVFLYKLKPSQITSPRRNASKIATRHGRARRGANEVLRPRNRDLETETCAQQGGVET